MYGYTTSMGTSGDTAYFWKSDEDVNTFYHMDETRDLETRESFSVQYLITTKYEPVKAESRRKLEAVHKKLIANSLEAAISSPLVLLCVNAGFLVVDMKDVSKCKLYNHELELVNSRVSIIVTKKFLQLGDKYYRDYVSENIDDFFRATAGTSKDEEEYRHQLEDFSLSAVRYISEMCDVDFRKSRAVVYKKLKAIREERAKAAYRLL